MGCGTKAVVAVRPVKRTNDVSGDFIGYIIVLTMLCSWPLSVCVAMYGIFHLRVLTTRGTKTKCYVKLPMKKLSEAKK